jgi:hypothetical protein
MGKKHASQYANFGWLPSIESIIKIASVSQTIGNMLAINGMTQILLGTLLISVLYSMVNTFFH